MDNIYIFGHKKPDTDAVTAPIILSYLKNKLGFNTEPRVLGSINTETKFVLDYFKVDTPKELKDVKLQIKDLKYQKDLNFNEYDSIYNAYIFMNNNKVSMIPVVDNKSKLIGIASMKDIAKNALNEDFNELKTSYTNIMHTLNGESLTKFDTEIKGNTLVASYQHQTFIDTINLDENSILIIGNRNKIIEYAIEKKVKLIVLTGNHELKDEHLQLALKNKVNIIRTKYDTFKTVRFINFSNYIKNITLTENIISFKEDDFVTEFTDVASKTKFSNFPVTDNEGKSLGLLKLANVADQKKKKVILVDHNEISQSVDGINEAEVVEVIDHHNIGSLGTSLPINFRTMPVGCTSTILYTLYKENNVKIPKNIAGLMTSAICSDTLLLKSPTTTDLDKRALEEVSKIAGVDWYEYGLEMLKAGSSLKGKTKEEILYTDFKNFEFDDKKMGIGQISTFDINEIKKDSDEYVSMINKIATNNDYDLLALFATDILSNGSYVFFNDSAKEIVAEGYKVEDIYQGYYLDGCVSRKKQMVPNLMETLKKH
ncbi:MAG: putative manganese-dependent inorganic diphosphatase [Bacilli bacterium]|nr:putative manganese-dependent inorganic diphosphatase [Bacilli bacterium]